MPAKRKTTTGRPTDDSSKKEKTHLVQSTLESCNDLDSIWEPTGDEIDEITDICDQLNDDENNDYNDGSVLNTYADKLDCIYDIVPCIMNTVRTTWFLAYDPDLAKNVEKKLKNRFIALRNQHSVAIAILHVWYPSLCKFSKQMGYIDMTKWENVRIRLSQDRGTTEGKNWLGKLYGLLKAKIEKTNRNTKWDEFGDLDTAFSDEAPGSCNDSDVDDDDADDNDDGCPIIDTGGETSSTSRGYRRAGSMRPRKGPRYGDHRSTNASTIVGTDIGTNVDNRRVDVPNRRVDVPSGPQTLVNGLQPLIDTLIDTESQSNQHVLAINKHIAQVLQSVGDIASECDVLHVTTAQTAQASKDLMDQQVKTENEKKSFLDALRRSYDAIYQEYMNMRRLVHSRRWWEQDFSSLTQEERYRVLESYSDGTHIPVTAIQKGQKFRLVSPVPDVVIPDFTLYSKEETVRLWNAVLPVPPASTTRSIDGMSLLHLPLDLQERIASNGDWPDDGLASTTGLHGDLPQMVAHARDKASGFHNVRQIIEKEYQFLLYDVTTTDSIGTSSSSESKVDEDMQGSQY